MRYSLPFVKRLERSDPPSERSLGVGAAIDAEGLDAGAELSPDEAGAPVDGSEEQAVIVRVKRKIGFVTCAILASDVRDVARMC